MSLIIDCHGHYTTAPSPHDDWRKAQTDAYRAGRRHRPPIPGHLRRRDPRDHRDQPAAPDSRARRRLHDLLAPGLDHGPPCRRRGGQPGLDAALQRPDQAGRRSSIRTPSPGLPAAAVAGRTIASSIAELERCVTGLGFIGCNLNPDPVRRTLDQRAADRPVLVPLLREDGRAGRAGDDPRLGVVQPANFHATGAHLHQRRHHRLHAVPGGRPVARTSPRCASSSRMAAGPCPTTGAAIGAWPTCSRSRPCAST
jgi:hypothetical protein